ncbi:hypothetical protein H7169_01830 [Candidatus Gracilibacteria bacterium]|nr:hypothetical protein [Candidatus Gracilibacteria bacterium]
MKKTHLKTTDFFSMYRSSQFRKYAFSGGIAIFVAFSFISLINSDIDTRGLMASVSNISETPHYDADLIMTREDSRLDFMIGSRANSVETIDLTLLGDPARLHSLTAMSPDIRVISQTEMGVYHISIDMHGRDIVAGTQVASLIAHMDTGAVLVIADTQFVSGGQRYSMSNKGE